MIHITENSNEPLHHYTLKAMNTIIELTFICKAEEAAYAAAFAMNWFRNVEDRFSRFQTGSELSHLNRLAGEPCMVSDTMLEVVHLAEMYWQITNGIFDPLLLNAMFNAGYTESFENLNYSKAAGNIDYSLKKANSNRIKINSFMKSIQLPDDMKMDLGGIVKSWAVNRLASHLQHKLQVNRGIINAGGDLTVWNQNYSNTNAFPWTIGIENPWHENEEIGQLILTNGSVATSSKLGRHWQTEQGNMHHIIDPRTMLPSDNDVVQCTVTGKNVVDCEIWAKVICIMGITAGLELLAEKTENYEALLFTSHKETHYYGREESLPTQWHDLSVDYYHSGGFQHD